MKLKCFAVLCLLMLAFASVLPAFAETESAPAGRSSVRRNVMVPMRDGTRLATDIYLPEGKGPWPVVLMRTPYGKRNMADAAYLEHGIALVAQDFRGRFASEGKIDMPFVPDGWGDLQDGYDTIEWIASQPWCNGKVATSGSSAGGITQVMTAGSVPPHLVCQSIGVACGSLYHHAAYPGGAFRKAMVEGWLQGNKFSKECLKTMLDHPEYDDLWRSVDAQTRSAQINVPGLFFGGWYDTFCQGTIDAFMWRQYEGGKGARGRQKLVMGPWVHGRKNKLGEFDAPPQGLQVPNGFGVSEWLESWLKDDGKAAADGPSVAYYVMGAFGEQGAPGHEWRTSDVWPIPCEETPFYLHSNGTLSRQKPPADGLSLTYKYDPKNPVPTRGGCNLVLDRGPFDQRVIESRPGVLLYTSEPLPVPLEVTGRIKAVLWASSSCKDTDFAVKLTDVYPDGRSMLVQDGIIRARYADSFERAKLLTPGRVRQFEVDLWSTSIIFNKGHRIRVAVSSSNSPRFEPNPNTGEPFRANDKTQVAENTIYHDAGHPSHILLPVIVAEETSGVGKPAATAR